MILDIPSLDVLDQHRNLYEVKKRNYREVLAQKERDLNQELHQSYFALPEIMKVSETKPKEIFMRDEPKKFSYLPSFERATDELRDNITNLAGALKITKNKTEENFSSAPSITEAQILERKFQPRNPYL